MKLLRNIIVAAALTLAVLNPNIESLAATWNDAYGVGNPGPNDTQITSSGIPFAVITSVISNLTYVPISIKPGSPAVIDDISFKTDACANSTIALYVATNMIPIASNATAGATSLWLARTNDTLATNDVCLLRHGDSDCYQLVVISGNATDYAGTVSTNALGEVNIKIFNAVSNAIIADPDKRALDRGDALFKLTRMVNISPLSVATLTNSATLISSLNSTSTCVNQWLPFTFSGTGSPDRVKFKTRASQPACIVLTHSNASGGGLLINGQYIKPTR